MSEELLRSCQRTVLSEVPSVASRRGKTMVPMWRCLLCLPTSCMVIFSAADLTSSHSTCQSAINQSITPSHSICQSINLPNNQFLHTLHLSVINQPTNHPINRTINSSHNESYDQLFTWKLNTSLKLGLHERFLTLDCWYRRSFGNKYNL